MEANLGGEDIFGESVTMDTVADPRARQINTYCGLNGVEYLDMGSRTGTTTVSGRFILTNQAELYDYIGQWETLRDGTTRDLHDSRGNDWPMVLIEQLRLVGRQKQSPDGRCIQDYQATLLHLWMP